MAIANVHNVEAEVLEFEVKANTKVTKHPIKDLKFSKNAVFSGVIRDGNALMTFGDFQIVPGDKVIVFTLLDAIHEVEEFFH